MPSQDDQPNEEVALAQLQQEISELSDFENRIKEYLDTYRDRMDSLRASIERSSLRHEFLEGHGKTVATADQAFKDFDAAVQAIKKALTFAIDKYADYPTTPEQWKLAEQEADEDLAAGNYEDFDSMEAFLADLMDGDEE